MREVRLKQKTIPTWIVVADSARANFYALRNGAMERIATTVNAHLEPHSRDAKSDRPGRAFGSSQNGVRSAIEPHHDYHKLEKHDFVRETVQILEKAFDEHQFERLVLVAPHRSLGELRTLLPHKMQASIWQEIGRDFTKLNVEELWMRISPHLKEHVEPH
jgi:protein required for attachment to host cells